jgi:cellulose synthase/poly-beta-1,6-N-acetylglucosamine synthase-like glycosyltransferase
MKVSIVIPCFNAERWLEQAIHSALSQDDIEPEVIVVDDSSTDQSTTVAARFGDRIQVLKGAQKGANPSRNQGLAQATGSWVQFLDADDFLEPRKIATQLREAADPDTADVLYSPVWIETWTDRCVAREQSKTSPAEDWDTQWIRWHIPQTGGALWRRSALLQLGGWKPDQPCCQEHELYLRARMAGLRFRYTPTPGAVYRIWSEDTLCRKDPVKVTQVRTTLMDQMWEWLEQTGGATAAHRKEIGQACFEMARTWARFNTSAAADYHAERKRPGFIHLAGPAAPASYRAAYQLFGFRAAEFIARSLRR